MAILISLDPFTKSNLMTCMSLPSVITLDLYTTRQSGVTSRITAALKTTQIIANFSPCHSKFMIL